MTADPVLPPLLTGRARSLDEAEETHRDEPVAEILELLGRPTPDAELARHPRWTRLRVRGSREPEDSPLGTRP